MDKSDDRNAIAWDWESFYSTKDNYSLAKMPTWMYCTDSRCEPYMLSMCGFEIFDEKLLKGESRTFDEKGSMFQRLDDGRQVYVGRPENFPCYGMARGRRLLSHNNSFDVPMTYAAIDRGLVPQTIRENRWSCTADLTAFLGCRRSLKDAMKHLFGREISKEVRASLDGRHDYELNPKEYRALVEYGGSDAIECHDIWLRFAEDWPEVERRMSELNREATMRGIRLDVDYLKESLKELKAYQAKVELEIPWVSEINPKTKEFYKAGSLPALRQAVINLGIEPPPSFAKADPRFLRWIEEHDDIPFIKARQKATSISMHIARLEGMLETLDPDGRSHPSFMYFGAHSGRFSGKSEGSKSSGNLLNLPRKPLFSGDENVFGGKGVDVRGMYMADPGRKFVIADFAQIEARLSLWLVDDKHMMAAIKEEKNLYGANAVAMGWCKPHSDIKHNDPELYKLAKAATLGLGYGMGAVKFVDNCKSQGLDLTPLPVEKWPEIDRRIGFILRNVARIKGDFFSEVNVKRVGQVLRALQVVGDWRTANQKIVDKWRDLENVFKSRVAAGKSTVAIRLPSGRIKRYFDPHLAKEPTVEVDENGVEHPGFRIAMKATLVRGDSPEFLSPGTLMENVIQSAARDVLVYGIVEIADKHPEWRYCWNVYDELIFDVPAEEADEAYKEITRIMCHGDYIKDWTEGMPLEVEGDVADRYHK